MKEGAPRQEKESGIQETRMVGGREIFITHSPYKQEIISLQEQIQKNTNIPDIIKEDINTLFAFLLLPIISDGFDAEINNPQKAHQARREWERTLSPEEKAFLDTNILAGGNISSIIPLFEKMALFASWKPEEYRSKEGIVPQEVFNQLEGRVNELKSLYTENYHSLSLEKKIAFMEKGRKFLLQAIQILLEAYI